MASRAWLGVHVCERRRTGGEPADIDSAVLIRARRAVTVAPAKANIGRFPTTIDLIKFRKARLSEYYTIGNVVSGILDTTVGQY